MCPILSTQWIRLPFLVVNFLRQWCISLLKSINHQEIWKVFPKSKRILHNQITCWLSTFWQTFTDNLVETVTNLLYISSRFNSLICYPFTNLSFISIDKERIWSLCFFELESEWISGLQLNIYTYLMNFQIQINHQDFELKFILVMWRKNKHVSNKPWKKVHVCVENFFVGCM